MTGGGAQWAAWAPAFAGDTGGGAGDTGWIPAFAGMTGGAQWAAVGGERGWIPAFAGMTRGGGGGGLGRPWVASGPLVPHQGCPFVYPAFSVACDGVRVYGCGVIGDWGELEYLW